MNLLVSHESESRLSKPVDPQSELRGRQVVEATHCQARLQLQRDAAEARSQRCFRSSIQQVGLQKSNEFLSPGGPQIQSSEFKKAKFYGTLERNWHCDSEEVLGSEVGPGKGRRH